MDVTLTSFRKLSGYRQLAEVLPLTAPFTIHVDPTNRCNFKCTFCPTGDDNLLRTVQRPKGDMSLELFRKIVGDIAEFDQKPKRLHLYKDGEPFLHRDLGGMIAYAKRKDVTGSVETTTNGSLLTARRAVEIIDAGLDQIRISVEHVTDEGYRELTETFSSYEKVRQNVERLFNEKTRRGSLLKIHSKIIDVNFSQEQKEKFEADFGPISDTINITSLMGWSRSEVKDFALGYTPTLGDDGVSPLKRDRKVCPDPFKTLAINFNGLVSVCCVDWSLGTIVGDVRTERLVDIWNGEKLHRFRMLHLTGQRQRIPACANCQYLQGMHPMTDLDDHAADLAKVYEARRPGAGPGLA